MDRKFLLTHYYAQALLWSEADGDEGNSLWDNYSVEDLDSSAITQIEKDIDNFLILSEPTLNELGSWEDDSLMYDFVLTRNHHGAGFWDGGWPKEIGNKLTEIAHSFSEMNCYIGDDGKIYV